MPRKKFTPAANAPAVKTASPKAAQPKTVTVPATKAAAIPSRKPIATPPAPRPAKECVVEGPDGRRITGKFAVLVELLRRPDGATIVDMCEATGWQKHSVRGAMSGLKQLGFEISSDKPANERIYAILPPPVPKPAKKPARRA